MPAESRAFVGCCWATHVSSLKSYSGVELCQRVANSPPNDVGRQEFVEKLKL